MNFKSIHTVSNRYLSPLRLGQYGGPVLFSLMKPLDFLLLTVETAYYSNENISIYSCMLLVSKI